MIMWLIMVPGILSSSTLFWLLVSGGELRSILVAAIVLCIVLMLAIFYRKTRWYAMAMAVALPLALTYYLQPVCQDMSPILISSMNPPIETRIDRDVYMNVFQQKPEGGWLECRTLLARQIKR